MLVNGQCPRAALVETTAAAHLAAVVVVSALPRADSGAVVFAEVVVVEEATAVGSEAAEAEVVSDAVVSDHAGSCCQYSSLLSCMWSRMCACRHFLWREVVLTALSLPYVLAWKCQNKNLCYVSKRIASFIAAL